MEFTREETSFLESMEETRIATSHDNIPHVKPVSFVFHNEKLIIATDYDTRTFSNVKSNPNVGIVIDIYKTGGHKAISLQGTSEIVENGTEFLELYDIFYKKFEWVRREPWKEDEAPFLKIIPKHKKSWGL